MKPLMTAQERHDAIRRIARDKRLSDAEALKQIAVIHQIGADQLIARDLRDLAKKKKNVTDRAKRYRAQKNRPPGPRCCNFCGNPKNVDIDHITGNEAEGELENLIYLCRSCNVRKGVVQARNKIGVRTMQFNPQPAASFEQFKNSAAILVGIKTGNAAKATAAIRATPPAKRAEYAERIGKNPPPDFKQYIRGVILHQRGVHDEGGKIIHATPPELRRKYAEEIAGIKARRRGSEVPF